MNKIIGGWIEDKTKLADLIRAYFKAREQLTTEVRLIFREERLVIVTEKCIIWNSSAGTDSYPPLQ